MQSQSRACRVLRSYPDPWQVHLIKARGGDEFIHSQVLPRDLLLCQHSWLGLLVEMLHESRQCVCIMCWVWLQLSPGMLSHIVLATAEEHISMWQA